MLHGLRWMSLGVLLVLLLAACGQTGGGTSAPGTGGGGAAATSVPAATAAPAATTAPAGGSGQPVADLGGRKLIVGSDTTYPPMEFIDEQTRAIQGFDVDMMQEIGKLINAQFEFQTFPSFDAIFAALAQGQFDLVVSSVSITDERKQIIDFSDPYLSIGQAIAVQASDENVKTVEDLKNVELVGIQGGTTGEEAVRKAGITEDKLRRYDTIDLAFQDLANGAIDAVVADGPPVARFSDLHKERVKVVGEPFTTEDYGIAIKKGSEELKNAINAAIKELKANGTMDQLMEKWNLQGVAELP